ncbi:MAG: DUF6438 domain-containing protein [Leadbetterella sp.]
MNKYLLFFLCIVFYSCKPKRNPQFEKDILGEWDFVKMEYEALEHKKSNPQKALYFEFNKDVTFKKEEQCILNLGFINRNFMDESGIPKIKYYGNKTKYKIEDDFLGMFNPLTNTWKYSKIISVGKDTLVLEIKEGVFEKYAKARYNQDHKESYDKIILLSSKNQIRLDKNGEVVYNGETFANKRGLFKSKISKEEYKDLEASFIKSNISNLNFEYTEGPRSSHGPDPFSILFIKNNKIIKSVRDNCHCSPPQFMKAYVHLHFLHQLLDLKPLENKDPMAYFRFEE